MFINELFESVIREAREAHSSQLFESVLREANGNEAKQESENKAEELIFLEDLVKMTSVLSTKKSKVIVHKSIGDVRICIGKPSLDSYGLRHIIYKRKDSENRTEDEITAMLSLICSAIHDGDPKPDYDCIKVTKNGITAIITRLVSERGKIGLLTGYDLDTNKKEATEAIQTVIARYSSTLEYSGLREQVVAVASKI